MVLTIKFWAFWDKNTNIFSMEDPFKGWRKLKPLFDALSLPRVYFSRTGNYILIYMSIVKKKSVIVY